MPLKGAFKPRRGFTLMELLVVVSIVIVVMLVFMTSFLGGSATPLQSTGLKIATMTTNIRQNAAVRKTHGELVLDYQNDRVISLSRERLVTFAFENLIGSNRVMGEENGTTIQASRSRNLLDGKALEFPTAQARFTIPWDQRFEVKGDYEGIAGRFDFYPFDNIPHSVPNVGQIATMGGLFTIEAVDLQRNAIRLGLVSGGVVVQDAGWVATERWCSIEWAVSKYGVSLYVDGRSNVGSVDADFEVPSAMNQSFELNGFEGRVDNLELYTMVSSEVVDMNGAQLLLQDVDPMLEATNSAENIYIEPGTEQSGPTTGSSETPEAYQPKEGLPPRQVTPIRHVYFDTAGQLDRSRHAGSVYIYVISYADQVLQRMTITIHPLGAVTTDYPEEFPWEQEEDELGLPAGGGE
ncbi:MAG: prepilin-type N-terminal cleavage/methylation domain-containing protein [Planctomycetota bacterium]|jgi:hypothetical protein